MDKLRGLMIVLMILDHVREYLHEQALLFQPTDVGRTTALLFATRWVTHLCAPTFVLLAGVAVGLQKANGRTSLRRYLVTRGLWLILLELSVIAFALDFAAPFLFLQVIWAIGFGMLLLAVLIHLPHRWVLAIGAVIVAGYPLLAPFAPEPGTGGAIAWTLLFQPGPLPWLNGFVAYPALPWFGIMALGFGMAPVFLAPAMERARTLVCIGLGMLALFLLLRGSNGYGDFQPWAVQAEAWRTALSFLNVSKYPPSLDFVLATLGCSLLFAPFVARLTGRLGRMLDAFGRASLFTYIVHIYATHGLALVIGLALGFPPQLFLGFLSDPQPLVDAGWGLGLFWIYLCWLAVCVTLYPLAAWFAVLKSRRREWWLRYL
ncbi:DUF1624 domain-containing protein [Sphingomonas oleivorans]|uniref:DUF1624 domain-containing protein n=1 Tax=Sphingomonas oleivorans TaxID=1735121 RepID=UPI0010570C79|nr:heparan-alpha-glucosaminide N-acetyltransferase domain-containing protein [Sphingomonas oleivorans]